MKVKIGIIGTGSTVAVAANHAKGYLKDDRAEIAAVFSNNISSSQEFVNFFNLSAKVCSTFDDLLEIVDAVDICTPNLTHIDYVVRAAFAHKAILVEKPLATKLEDCQKALTAVQEASVFNMMGFVYRFAPHAAVLKKLLQDNFTQIYTISASLGASRIGDPSVPFEWRMDKELSGTGALGDFGSHLLDLIKFTSGIEFQHGNCFINTFIKERYPDKRGKHTVENDDAAVFCGMGARGELVSATCSRLGMDKVHLFVTGDGGMIRLDYDSNVIFYEKKAIGGGYEGKKQTILINQSQDIQMWFDKEVQIFIDGIMGIPVDICTISDAVEIDKVLFSLSK